MMISQRRTRLADLKRRKLLPGRRVMRILPQTSQLLDRVHFRTAFSLNKAV